MLVKAKPDEPAAKRWSRAEYHRLGEEGWFDEQRTELIAGEIFVMSPQSSPHYRAICKVVDALEAVFGDGYWVRGQGPLALDDDSEPEPDVSVVRGSYEDFDDHPTSALLVVEVSLTSLPLDRGVKAEMYARSQISEYWVVNIAARQLEVYREPTADGDCWRYTSVATLTAVDAVSPLAAPQSSIPVGTLLP